MCPSVAIHHYCMQTLGHDVRTSSSALSDLKEEKHQLEDEMQEHIKQRAKMELHVKDLEQNVTDNSTSKVVEHVTWDSTIAVCISTLLWYC